MPALAHERYCAEVIAQTDLLRDVVRATDLGARVPTTPDWDLGELAVHVGGAHRWAAVLVSTRAQRDIPDDEVPGFYGPEPRQHRELEYWLAEGAELLANALREAGPDAPVWTWAQERTAGFWARRMTHETVVHRADAAGAAGPGFEVAPDVAADTLDEWLEILDLAQRNPDDEDLAALRDRALAGRTLHLHATDAPGAEWLIELGEAGFSWERAHRKADVALRGPIADVLRVFYRRLPADSGRVEVLGDAKLLQTWLERASWS
ncbi:maleylpyruvate isomerase family mycothiol-dependent enzyme [Streptomyces sp. A7024]|uniref:Maleylpyruvate isomerase family mycothiol-dependent enzyme n=1 Tax=Streptomyces coryli TaxID=1128680 RepID=A0A6G4U4M4_9ACTN|nr:maleylpyruvate isomerase N-terminal domain-containing protein [Streptomyces coryli]NGN67124.1 maleylpyruvate isomerase family mycothiol-dependent enzyme [Streptomyces coryli]